jgi:hypothetical protein
MGTLFSSVDATQEAAKNVLRFIDIICYQYSYAEICKSSLSKYLAIVMSNQNQYKKIIASA